ncbi:MAG: flagellar basal body-associated FliL family protein [Syntrophomonadaceae bacterium]|nr:flagellar basal body-associated FliL family protein [Syntrophomonadaceae bacterium]
MADEQQPGKNDSKIKWIALMVSMLCIAASVFVYFTFMAQQSAAVSPKNMKSATLPSMTVNLADIGGNRYLKTTITLEYSDEKLTEELGASMYKVKDAVLKVLRSTQAKTFEDPQQLEALKQTLLDEINSRLQTGKVTGLYFEELLVQ